MCGCIRWAPRLCQVTRGGGAVAPWGRLVNDRFIAHGAAVAIFVSSVVADRAPLAAAFSGANHKGAARRRASGP
ncbi:hypothetical protein PSP6_460003 [Paraburkholderia tropica]|nr:hypothetical protein PSP6_460003 [Paraburkholderia tropica]